MSGFSENEDLVDEAQKILVVEDAVTRARLAFLLRKNGYQVDVADNGDAGWTRFQELHYSIVPTRSYRRDRTDAIVPTRSYRRDRTDAIVPTRSYRRDRTDGLAYAGPHWSRAV